MASIDNNEYLMMLAPNLGIFDYLEKEIVDGNITFENNYGRNELIYFNDNIELTDSSYKFNTKFLRGLFRLRNISTDSENISIQFEDDNKSPIRKYIFNQDNCLYVVYNIPRSSTQTENITIQIDNATISDDPDIIGVCF